MTWVTPPHSLPRDADELICGREDVAEVVYAESCEAEEARDRRHDFSDHLEPWVRWLDWLGQSPKGSDR